MDSNVSWCSSLAMVLSWGVGSVAEEEEGRLCQKLTERTAQKGKVQCSRMRFEACDQARRAAAQTRWNAIWGAPRRVTQRSIGKDCITHRYGRPWFMKGRRHGTFALADESVLAIKSTGGRVVERVI